MFVKSSIEKDLTQLYTKLLQGFVHKDDMRLWSHLLMHQNTAREYFAKLNLFLHLDELDGYAFLKSSPTQEEEIASITNESAMGVKDTKNAEELKGSPLMRRMPLSFEVTLLLVLLREALIQFDESSRDDHRLILSRSEIYELLKTFYKDRCDEIKLIKRFDALISKIIELQAISELKNHPDKIEVHRVIRAIVDAQKLSEIKLSLRAYAEQELRE